MPVPLWIDNPCPVCGAEDDCAPECYLSERRNTLIHSTVRVLTDEAGEDFIHGNDVLHLLKAFMGVLEVTGGVGDPITTIHNDGIRRAGWFICAALDPDSGIRTAPELAADIPDHIPAEWLTSGGSNDN
jgi:hypothetical protein